MAMAAVIVIQTWGEDMGPKTGVMVNRVLGEEYKALPLACFLFLFSSSSTGLSQDSVQGPLRKETG